MDLIKLSVFPALLRREQASWPLRLGGLGLRSVSPHAPAAFLASCVTTSALQARILGPAF